MSNIAQERLPSPHPETVEKPTLRPTTSLRIVRGHLLVQRAFDIADEIDLNKAAALLKEPSRRAQFVKHNKRIRFPNPPLELSLAKHTCGVPGLDATDVRLRIYDVGAITVTFTVPLPHATTSPELIQLGIRVFDAHDAITAEAQKIIEEMCAFLRSACKGPEISPVFEDYTTFVLEGVEPAVDAKRLPQLLDIPRLLLGDTGPIVDDERDRVMEASFSYRPDELVVINWDSGLIYNPSADPDIDDLLELVTVQLLELRTYDDEVGRYLDRLYDELESDRFQIFLSSNYQRLSRQIMRLFVEVTEITERIENALQHLGDTWFARVHHAAVKEFEIHRWQKQLADKLELLRQINEMLVDQISTRKSLRLELAIVLLIIVEMVLAVWKHG